MIKGFMESNLSQSEIFKGLRQMADIDPLDKAIKLAKSAKRLTNEDIEGAYIQVKQYSNSLSRAAVKAFDEGTTVLLYNDVSSLSTSQAIPFVTFKGPTGGYQTFVFMDQHVKTSREGVMSVQAPILHDLLLGALISNRLKSNYERLESSQFLQTIFTNLYTKFVCRILNKDFSIGADKIVYDTVQYWVARFFLVRVFGSKDTPENIEKVAAKHFKYVDEMKYDEIKKAFDEHDPQEFTHLLELIKTSSVRMKTLGLDNFLSSWINYYYPPAMLAVDVMEYFIFMVLVLLHGTPILSIAPQEIVKETRNIKLLEAELLKLI